MDCNTKSRLPRQGVLIVAEADGHISAYGDENIIVRFSRVPVAHSLEAERIAEDFLHASLPPFWHQLYWPGKRRATATLTPLLPSTLAAAKATQRSVNELNDVLASVAEVEGEKWMTV